MTQLNEQPKMDNFYTIRFKRATAKRFKRFSKTVSKSYSETMELMIHFFEWHGFLPSDRFGKSIIQEITKNRKRTEATIAIIKDIEKHQTKPTSIMLQALLEETEHIEKEEEAIHDFGTPTLITENEELLYYRTKYDIEKKHYNDLKNQMETLIQKASYIKSGFGKGYFRLDMTKEAFENLKQQLEHVHHHHTTETRG